MSLQLDLPTEILQALARQTDLPVEQHIAQLLEQEAAATLPEPPKTPLDATDQVQQAHRLRERIRALETAYDELRAQIASYLDQRQLHSLETDTGAKARLQHRWKLATGKLPEALEWLKAQGKDDLIQVKETISPKTLSEQEDLPEGLLEATSYVVLSG